MKIKILYIAVCLYLPASVMAQPVMTRDWIGSIGDQFMGVLAAELPSPGDSGENITWDFSGVMEDTLSLEFELADPTDTPYEMNFPMSNLVSVSSIGGFDMYNYYVLDNDLWENFGVATDVIMTIYEDPQMLLQFPFNYTDKFIDDYKGISSFLGVITEITGTIEVEADAYGIVLMPGGNFDDVLRVKTYETNVDSTDLGLGIIEKIVETSMRYSWYSNQHPGPLATYDIREKMQIAIVPPLEPDTMFFTPDTAFSFDPTAISSSIEFVQGAFDLTVSPNPASDFTTLTFDLERPELLQVKLHTLDGQMVFYRQVNGTGGPQSFNMNLVNLAPSIYVLTVMGKKEGSVQKVLKHNRF